MNASDAAPASSARACTGIQPCEIASARNSTMPRKVAAAPDHAADQVARVGAIAGREPPQPPARFALAGWRLPVRGRVPLGRCRGNRDRRHADLRAADPRIAQRDEHRLQTAQTLLEVGELRLQLLV
jgi:hypothetical protein